MKANECRYDVTFSLKVDVVVDVVRSILNGAPGG